jgi:hypothetical protein
MEMLNVFLQLKPNLAFYNLLYMCVFVNICMHVCTNVS